MIKIIDAPAELVDASVVGHKFARQQQLRDAGVSVPPFFCVVGETPWTAIADAVGIFPGAGAGVEELTAWAEAARGAAENVPLLPETEIQIRERYAALSSPDVAVRACVVGRHAQPGEDDAADPFAGLTDSYLYVGADALIDAIAFCAASLFSVRSILYRARRGIDPRVLSICVGIQQMIDGERSFVAFTHDPATGAKKTVVAAVYGIGEGAVAERADIDHFFVGADGIGRLISHKERMLRRAPGGGVAEYRVPDILADLPVFSDEQIDQIAALAATTERLLSGPQDIEGVVTADSAIHLVQARPATSPQTPTTTVEWTNHNLTESFPGVTTAMTYSHARVFYRMSFRDFYRIVGVPGTQLRSREHQLRRMIGYLDGRAYYRLDAWYALHSQLPGWDVLRPMWERSLGLAERNPNPGHMPDRHAISRIIGRSPRLIWAAMTFPRRLRRFLSWWDAQHILGAEVSQKPVDEIIETYRRVWSEAESRWGVTILASYLSLAGYVAATVLVRRWTDSPEVDLTVLMPGGPPNRTLQSVHSTVALAEQINAHPALSARVLTADARDTWNLIARGAYGEKLESDAHTHLKKFGDRAMHDLKIEQPTPRQRPEMVIDALRPFVAAGVTMQQTRLQESTAAAVALDELHRMCPSRWRRVILRAAVRVGRFLVKAREDTRFCRTQLYGFSREVMRRLGSELVVAGCLDSPEDYVHLEVEELLGAFDGTSTHPDLRVLVKTRKDAYLRSCDRPAMAAHFTTPPPPIAAAELHRRAATSATASSSSELTGLPSSAGIARGRAKLILRPDVPPSDCAGRILIARETDPGWLPVMLTASGLVVERGSMVSHTAITGRMLGIPTVVAVRGATSRIRDGDELEIDGRSGIVRILRPHSQIPR
ncbi:PEP/pyruvate-binding domain-containing protein [Mycolicibacterium arseniciresistens]|uniref:PEP/pyruvate-binding domain-containing protein n=1 Tax=Mycolicibacterium arseniciresistens TaxID=3062257 RepID=A0ABT8UGB5_9MYCO|nr:PEP/pyruvate-binding domain-containing protein [Mycolicibacterium arseniciresistens]MDO3635219.1 PEP/pyruvate-binding domain-containing protein [Mycolicibacterium arseniciresistens]